MSWGGLTKLSLGIRTLAVLVLCSSMALATKSYVMAAGATCSVAISPGQTRPGDDLLYTIRSLILDRALSAG